MLIKLESGDYINPDRVDGITMFEGSSNIVAIVHYSVNNRFHVNHEDLNKILEWHNKPAIPSARHVVVDCRNCKHRVHPYSGCIFCQDLSGFQPKD